MTQGVILRNAGRMLVTGANGFVGRALCGELMKRSMRVRGAVRARIECPSESRQRRSVR